MIKINMSKTVAKPEVYPSQVSITISSVTEEDVKTSEPTLSESTNTA